MLGGKNLSALASGRQADILAGQRFVAFTPRNPRHPMFRVDLHALPSELQASVRSQAADSRGATPAAAGTPKPQQHHKVGKQPHPYVRPRCCTHWSSVRVRALFTSGRASGRATAASSTWSRWTTGRPRRATRWARSRASWALPARFAARCLRSHRQSARTALSGRFRGRCAASLQVEPETEAILLENDVDIGDFSPAALACLPTTPWQPAPVRPPRQWPAAVFATLLTYHVVPSVLLSEIGGADTPPRRAAVAHLLDRPHHRARPRRRALHHAHRRRPLGSGHPHCRREPLCHGGQRAGPGRVRARNHRVHGAAGHPDAAAPAVRGACARAREGATRARLLGAHADRRTDRGASVTPRNCARSTRTWTGWRFRWSSSWTRRATWWASRGSAAPSCGRARASPTTTRST